MQWENCCNGSIVAMGALVQWEHWCKVFIGARWALVQGAHWCKGGICAMGKLIHCARGGIGARGRRYETGIGARRSLVQGEH